ncbi:MAG: hypothetical protein E6R13_02605 [Spirochaetes bacterium]|nr:MAG: hypothetical protein E6R13_02605 [Spirochaetota bacterium]
MSEVVIQDRHLDGVSTSELRRFKIANITPTAEQELGRDSTSKRLVHFSDGIAKEIPHMEDLIEKKSFQGILTTATYPTVANLDTLANNTTITKGDTWVFNIATPANMPSAPAYGNIKVSSGDKIMALVDNATVATDFSIFNANIDDTLSVKNEQFTVAFTAGAPATVTLSATPTVKPSVISVTASTGEQRDIGYTSAVGSTIVTFDPILTSTDNIVVISYV